jgi:two-component system, OmpR family, response regulator
MARVLAIEDERGTRRLLSRVLEHDGHEVVGAPTGLQGLHLASTEEWDLILLDLLLPDLRGTAVLSAVLDNRPAQKVMVLSAVSDTESRVACLERGAVDYLAKPFAVRELRARVNSRLSAPRPDPGTHVHQVGDLRLDRSRHRLQVDGKDVDLTPRELLLMEYLMSRPGEVCTREELLTEVWGYAFDPGSNVIDVTVGRLRAKVGDAVIETVRHVGYSLRA